jgi:hypothetical protein
MQCILFCPSCGFHLSFPREDRVPARQLRNYDPAAKCVCLAMSPMSSVVRDLPAQRSIDSPSSANQRANSS